MRKSILAVTAALILALAVRADLLSFLSGGVASGGGGGGPGTDSMVAAFEFDDTVPGEGNDDSFASFDWDSGASVTYTTTAPGYATTVGTADADKLKSDGNSLNANFCSANQDWSFAVRVRISGSITNGDYIISGNFDRFRIRYLTSSTMVELMDVVVDSSQSLPSMGTGSWVSIIASFAEATDTLTIWLNGTKYTNTGTGLAGSGGTLSLQNEADWDYLYMWGKQLTDENAAYVFANNAY